jgi:hypothetical protein
MTATGHRRTALGAADAPSRPSPTATPAATEAAAAAWAAARVTELSERHTAQTSSEAAWEVPAYGSAQWCALRPDDPRRTAAVIEAAELWRQQQAEEQRLAELAEADPEAWFREVTAEADAAARPITRTLAHMRAARGSRAAWSHRPPHRLQATPGWPPIAVPGRPGHFLHPARRAA